MNGLDLTRLKEHVSGQGPSALDTIRERAIASLESDGLPSTRHEDWKYTDLSGVARISDAWLANPAAPISTTAADSLLAALVDDGEVDWLLLRNGNIETAGVKELAGVTVSRLSDGAHKPELTTPLAALNAALISDGLVIDIESTPERPLGLLFLDDAADSPGLSQTRVDIRIAAEASAELIEYHASFGDNEHYGNAVLTLEVAAAATVRHLRVQNRSRAHSQTQRLDVRLARDARFLSASFDLGGKLTRNDLDVDLVEAGAHAEFRGLYLSGDGQHMDNHARVDHRVGPASSRQEYRGILFGRARAVWNGKAVVHEGADGTDAEQANHNLLLSEHAEIDTKPELEIYAEDVRCSHGTTVGQLDEKALFYLRSRGLAADDARRLLVRAFAAETLQSVPIPALTDHLGGILEHRLADIKDIPLNV
ncbi:MAG: Fe-S cluster assembly protein SufD [Pseudomonadota bacterium]